MGRTVVYDALVTNIIEKCPKFNSSHCGLLIGSSTFQRDIVVYVTPTPSKDEIELENVQFDKECVKKKSKKVTTYEESELDEAWICQHARQVTRMLPGGLDVLGIYLHGTPDYVAKNTANLRQILFAMYKAIAKDQQLGFCSRIKDRIQLHLCSITRKATCKTFDVSDYKSAARPGEWKPLATSIQWSQLETEYHLDQWIPIGSSKSKQSLLKQIQSGLEPLYTSVGSAMVLIDGKMREGSEILSQSSEGSKKGKPKVLVQKLNHKVEIFISLNLNKNSTIDPEMVNCGAGMLMKGVFHCRAFAPSKSTVEEAILAIKQDIMRSLTSRCEIHCEDMLFINEEQQDPSLVHELPRRVFTQLPGCEISVSDYVYHGDSAKDSLEAFQELLNLQLREEDIDTSLEQNRSSKDFSEPDMEERLSEAGEQVIEAISSRRNIILPAISAAVLATAITVGYFFLLEN